MHQSMLAGWASPEAPTRYPDLSVIKLSLEYGHSWRLDFSREENGDRWYASDAEKCPTILWPWVEGFEPASSDWSDVGFKVILEMHDSSGVIRPRSPAEGEIHSVMLEALFDHDVVMAGALKKSGSA